MRPVSVFVILVESLTWKYVIFGLDKRIFREATLFWNFQPGPRACYRFFYIQRARLSWRKLRSPDFSHSSSTRVSVKRGR
ncbi:hypothetical protein EJ02DRAFT_135342 [Clathrospora elynae]|uniref:Uncharacterized protein n=1 Tax=Clathrospora elynae TaxID=706981 RepID=A0A6A5S3R8_9PLEO|nr:hypothetical protein EJ02DRAFT_135342 [Clathrospora elynae]